MIEAAAEMPAAVPMLAKIKAERNFRMLLRHECNLVDTMLRFLTCLLHQMFLSPREMQEL
jgi:hypothetical protein